MNNPHLERTDGARIIHLGDGPNLFDETFIATFDGLLSELEAEDSGGAVVITATGKFFSNGFDLDFLGSLSGETLGPFIDRACRLLARILVFPAPTVAAVNGHAFGIGAMTAIACDQQVMRADRGWWCLPEVDLGMSFAPFMLALVTERLPARTAQHAMLTGRRYDAAAALEAGVVDAVASEAGLLPRALEMAAPWTGKQPKVVRAIKKQLHAATIAAL
jgi:enoyl-CoA hydratase/carnithine racemase